jgi:hypothetical protein
MPCTVTISSVTATGPPLTAVDVAGTATVPDCTTVRVVLECGGSPGPKLIVPVDVAGNWVAHFAASTLKGSPCACGRSYVVTATCEQSPECDKAVATGEFNCGGRCPTAVVGVAVGDCTPDGHRNVTFTATLTPGTDPVIVTQWEVEPGVFASASPLLAYSTQHSYAPGSQFTAILHVILPTGCPDLATVVVGPLADCPCPDLGLSVAVAGCAGPAPASATATFTATLTPPGVNCGPYHWTFGDGTNDVTVAPTTTHSYGAPGSYSASVAVACGACLMTEAATVAVPKCPNGPDNGDGEGFGCFGARVLMTVAAILAIVAISLAICVPPPVAAVLAWIALGLGILAALTGILWGILCPKPCAWGLLLAWQVSIGVGFVLLYFTTCCPTFWFIGLPLIGAGIALMFVWQRRCHMSNCAVLKELSIALSSVVLPLLGWLGAIPGLSACVNHVVAGILSTIAAAVVVAALHCIGPAQPVGPSQPGGPTHSVPLTDLRMTME